MKATKKHLWFLLLALPLLPFVIWFVKPSESLQITILDKTVPNEEYREHAGLVWLLNHLKITTSANDHYNVTDYKGWHPEKRENEKIAALSDSDTNEADLIYVADTYGIYPDQTNDSERGTDPIYGGLTVEEAAMIKDSLLSKPTTLVTEFNTLASPTSDEAQESLQGVLGVDWTGWTGRYFIELDPNQNNEVPNWIIENYQTQSGSPWSYDGAGIVFSHESGDIFVLQQEDHFADKGIWLEFTEEGQDAFGLTKSPQYGYWFDIHTVRTAMTLADYKLDLTETGKSLLTEHNIPLSFPAITLNKVKDSDAYYFAGDFVDTDKTPLIHQFQGLINIQQWFSFEKNGRQAPFYWKTYIPVMKKILQDLGDGSDSSIAEEEMEREPYYSKVNGEQFEVLHDGEWKEINIKGVNLGIGKPGYFPGETSITYEEYYRWFEQISEMNANTIRNYTLHPPEFYQALEAFNKEHPENPLYLFHGVWAEEKPMEEHLDAFHPESNDTFVKEMKTIVDVIHGNANVEKRPGHAGGLYTADISRYVIGWIIGIEWYPYMVENTNNTHQDVGQYDGQYVYTQDAAPFEYWLAEKMDIIMSYDAENYDSMRPISFTNWVTTDLLDHPVEPLEQEDLVGVDPNKIYLKDSVETGQFASYHVYPYYPDFLNLDPKYLEYVDHRGNKNSYAGYLNDLQAAHRIPVLIAEFGVPGSRGKTHENPYGWNQGGHSEESQGDINSILYEDIMQEGMLGGLVFTWQDEWFKRTWNTMELDNPDRRPYWSNAQTNEQQFGLLSFDRHKIGVDGNNEDWQETPSLYKKESTKDTLQVEEVKVEHDERYLYMLLKMNDLQKYEWEKHNMLVYLDTNGETHGNDRMGNIDILSGTDFVLHLNGKEQSRLLVDSYYDPNYYQYSENLGYIEKDANHGKKNTGQFNPINLTLNRPLVVPTTGETLPFSNYETGKFTYGIGNPESDDYNSLADFYVNEEEGLIEVRIPWLMLNFRDPSQKEIIGDLWKNGMEASSTIDDIRLAVAVGKGEYESKKGWESFELIDSLPQSFTPSDVTGYEWENWDIPPSQERLKQSYYIMQDLYENY